MARKILVVVNSDPRTSPRPAEAIRIAAGVGAWKKVEVSLVLCESAVLSLTEFPDELVDEDNFVRYLPIVKEFGRPVYVETGAPLLKDLGETPVPYERITVAQLAAMAAASDCVLRFQKGKATMRNVLILVTESMEPLNDVVIAAQGNLPDARVEVMDLTVDAPDYGAVVEKVFAADSVQVW